MTNTYSLNRLVHAFILVGMVISYAPARANVFWLSEYFSYPNEPWTRGVRIIEAILYPKFWLYGMYVYTYIHVRTQLQRQ